MILRRALSTGVLVFAFFANGCLCRSGSACDTGNSDGGDVDPATAATAILTNQCATCHGGSAPSGGLDLSTPQAITATVNRTSSCTRTTSPLITPGDPGHSYLIEKVEAAMPSCGDRMPLVANPLSPAQIQRLRDWITQMPH